MFAVDQLPFDDSGKWFCFLYPLMTLEGDRLEATAANFPNTGRIWWMIGESRHPYAIPGAVWTGPIEEHPGWSRSKDNPRHNRFQAKKDAIRHGGNDLIEILTLSHIEPTPDLIYKGAEIPMGKPPTPRVFLRGKQSVLGPVKASWDSERLSATFEGIVVRAINPDHPSMLHIPTEDFDRLSRVESFSFEARQLDFASSPLPLNIRLTRSAWLQWEGLLEASVIHDAFKDNELINWAIRSVDDFSLSRQERREVNAFLDKVRKLSAPSEDAAFQRRLQRLREIADDVVRTTSLGEEVASILAEGPFKELVEAHLDSMTADAIQKEIERRRKDILAEVAGVERQLERAHERLAKEEAALSQKLAAQKADHDARLAEEIATVAAREEALAQRERKLQSQQEAIQRATEALQTEGQAVVDQWLTLLPLLAPVQQGTGGASSAPCAPETTAPASLALPVHLSQPRKLAEEPITEARFLQQFAQVVADEGFLFEEDDLYNFHICVKTGYMTILAGHTGMGKSSLPRLYARALGCEDEYMHLSVRPDWLDDRDLLGAYNAITRRFEPASAGFSEQLICAQLDRQKERGGVYLFCLDEMNLARVEHYFAQFLSTLEQPEEQRAIHLFGAGLVAPEDPYAPYRTIALGDNIRFVGTVNIDETAFFFSPKVLDRAQIIVFQDPDLGSPLPTPPSSPRPIAPVSLETFQSWCQYAVTASKARTFLLDIDRILRQSRLGFGFRQFERMLTYLASADGVLPQDKAVDFQLMQVALPRLRRTAPRFSDTLLDLIDIVDERRYPRSADMLNRIKESEAEDDFFQLI